jgi:hypothetical protein
MINGRMPNASKFVSDVGIFRIKLNRGHRVVEMTNSTESQGYFNGYRIFQNQAVWQSQWELGRYGSAPNGGG